jgi:type II secretory pathway pseudopilin PulG
LKLLKTSRRAQGGYILLALIFASFLLAMAALAVTPHLAQQIRREREQELINRGQQYARAVQLFYRKFGRFPSRIEELENTNNIRFLRRRYTDPITGSDEWRVIHFGQAKTTPTGFTGTPGGAASPGTPAGALGRPPGAQPPGAQQPGARQPGTPAEQISRPAGRGQTFGGAGIIGVASTSERQGIKEVNGRSRYNEWEFVYDPRFDAALQQRGVGQPGIPGQQPGQPQRPGGPQQPGAQPAPQQQQPFGPGPR